MQTKPRRDWAVFPVLILGLPFLIATLILGMTSAAFNVPASSMRPNLEVGDHFWAWRRHYQEHAPERGEIAVFLTPRGDAFIKRVIGLPGDTIQMKSGRLWINGAAVERTADGTVTNDLGGVFKRYRERLPNGVEYPILETDDASMLDETEAFQVPADSYFLMGDNRDNSNDSRMPEMGAIPRARFIAKPYLIYYSPDLDRIGLRLN